MTSAASGFDKLRVLLLQARTPDDPAKAEEVDSFARAARLEASQFTSHDLLEGPPTLHQLHRFDALMIGGSGDFYVSKRDLPEHHAIINFLGELSAHPSPNIRVVLWIPVSGRGIGWQHCLRPRPHRIGHTFNAVDRRGTAR